MAATGALGWEKLGTRFDDTIPFYDTIVEASWINADLKLFMSSNTPNQ
jgi:hypothetical protein